MPRRLAVASAGLIVSLKRGSAAFITVASATDRSSSASSSRPCTHLQLALEERHLREPSRSAEQGVDRHTRSLTRPRPWGHPGTPPWGRACPSCRARPHPQGRRRFHQTYPLPHPLPFQPGSASVAAAVALSSTTGLCDLAETEARGAHRGMESLVAWSISFEGAVGWRACQEAQGPWVGKGGLSHVGPRRYACTCPSPLSRLLAERWRPARAQNSARKARKVRQPEGKRQIAIGFGVARRRSL